MHRAKNALNNIWKKKKYLYILIIIVLIIFTMVLTIGGRGNNIEYSTVSSGSITERITVTGRVISMNKADLSFEKGGVISKINYGIGDSVSAGDTIISLDSADIVAQLKGAKANLLSEKAKLAELKKGLRPEELSVEDARLKNAQTNSDNSRKALLDAMHDAYVKVDMAMTNYTDNLFNNPQTVVPKITVLTQSYNQQNSVNNSRILVGEDMKLWKNILDNIDSGSEPYQYLANVHKYLDDIKSLLSQLSNIVNNLNVGNSGLDQEAINTYNTYVNNAQNGLNLAVASLTTAESAYSNSVTSLSLANEQFNLKKAGSSYESIQAEQARVDQADANVQNYQAELLKKSIISPISGVLTKMVPSIGEFVQSGQIVATVMTDVYKVEVKIPEIDIAKVSLDNIADITLDAYGKGVVFTAHVVAIDPAETMVDNVPTYKVTLQFDNVDNRIKSGMTANIDIITTQKDNILKLPFRAIIDKGGKKFVRLVDNTDTDDYKEVEVSIGIHGDDGSIEILDGLSDGDRVITQIK